MRLNDCVFTYAWGNINPQNPDETLLTASLAIRHWKVEHNEYFIRVNEEVLLKHLKSELGDKLYEAMVADFVFLQDFVEPKDQGPCEYCSDRDLDCECVVTCSDCGTRDMCYCEH